MRRLLLVLLLVASLAAYGQRREVHIVAVNDVHASIERMPALAAIIDSLRSLYPSLLVFSAGDNRTGNPLSDMYEIPGYPMVAMMNLLGFNGSAVGNHDFDVASLPKLIGYSNFRYICANMKADDSTGIRTVPYQLFDVDGMTVGVVGVVQLNAFGRPDTHPDNLRGVRFEDPARAVERYEWLSGQCDATILLSHAGYMTDKSLAETAPWLDLIIGGHTHTQLTADEPLHNGVLITQNKHGLRTATHITLTVEGRRVVGKKAEYLAVNEGQFVVTDGRIVIGGEQVTIDNGRLIIDNGQGLSDGSHGTMRIAEHLVYMFGNNPVFKRVLTRCETPFESRREVGCMACDALMAEGHADVALFNYRGIRLRHHKADYFTVADALATDPFGNQAVELTLTGRELYEVICIYSRGDLEHFPHIGGLRAELTVDHNDSTKIKNIRLMAADGGRFDMDRLYRVITNTYVAAYLKESIDKEDIHIMNVQTSDMIMNYLEKQQSISYQNVSRITIIEN